MRQLVLLCLRTKLQLVDVVNDFAQVVPALNAIADFAEDLADLVFNGVWARGLLLEGA
jgi:uncharacterized protein with PhoU and TrkA domain